MPVTPTTRLNKFISESGICSRREADRFIEQGQVLINGKPARVGDQVGPRDRVSVNGQKLEAKQAEDAIYLAFNKPVGITSTSEPGVRGNIVDYVNHAARIFPIGRLDKDSQGLIFLTSDGDIVNKILRAGNKHEKEYLVTVNRILSDQMLHEMAHGVPMLGVVTKKCLIQKETPYIFRITLVQGLNRQIRRMVEHFGYEVTKLERVRIMNVSIKGLGVGDWRDLTALELANIMKMVEHSSGTEDASGGRKPVRKQPALTEAQAAARRPARTSAAGWWGPRPDKPAPGAPKPRTSGGLKSKTAGGQRQRQRPAKPGTSRAAKAPTGKPRPGGAPRR